MFGEFYKAEKEVVIPMGEVTLFAKPARIDKIRRIMRTCIELEIEIPQQFIDEYNNSVKDAE